MLGQRRQWSPRFGQHDTSGNKCIAHGRQPCCTKRRRTRQYRHHNDNNNDNNNNNDDDDRTYFYNYLFDNIVNDLFNNIIVDYVFVNDNNACATGDHRAVNYNHDCAATDNYAHYNYVDNNHTSACCYSATYG